MKSCNKKQTWNKNIKIDNTEEQNKTLDLFQVGLEKMKKVFVYMCFISFV